MRLNCALLQALCAGLAVSATLAAGQKEDRDNQHEQAHEKGPMRAATFAGFELRSIGPALMSGRIADIAMPPKNRSTWYVAVGSGNLWKTTNSGTTWKAIFDDQGFYSIGCVTIHPSRPEIVWVGTGENVGGRHVGYGDGVYRSLDGGASWEKLRLGNSQHIGNIIVDPRDSNVGNVERLSARGVREAAVDGRQRGLRFA